MTKIGFIGCGNMGGALAAVAAKAVGGENVYTADPDGNKTALLHDRAGTVTASTEEICRECGMIFLGVKPQVMPQAAQAAAGVLAGREKPPVAVTMAAGLSIAQISAWLGGCPVIRIMPNLPAAVGEGVILYCPGEGISQEDEDAFKQVLAPAGMIEKLNEDKIDAASAVTGCGPAFMCLIAEAMTDGAVRCGLTRDQARRFALQTMSGTAKYLLTGDMDPAVLRGAVCSPAGSTIEGVRVLEEKAVRGAVMDAVWEAYRRSLQLGNPSSGQMLK